MVEYPITNKLFDFGEELPHGIIRDLVTNLLHAVKLVGVTLQLELFSDCFGAKHAQVEKADLVVRNQSVATPVEEEGWGGGWR